MFSEGAFMGMHKLRAAEDKVNNVNSGKTVQSSHYRSFWRDYGIAIENCGTL